MIGEAEFVALQKDSPGVSTAIPSGDGLKAGGYQLRTRTKRPVSTAIPSRYGLKAVMVSV